MEDQCRTNCKIIDDYIAMIDRRKLDFSNLQLDSQECDAYLSDDENPQLNSSIAKMNQ